jgi:hypothetical protein
MSIAVPSPDPTVIPPAVAEETYRLALDEARAQAEALRHAVCQATDLLRQLEELIESLRAILVYPKAYDWPPEPTADTVNPCGEREPELLVQDLAATARSV